MKNSFAYLDAKSKAIIWNAYAENFSCEEILDEGFNINSGYVYIVLENGVTIASAFAQDPVYFVNDPNTWEEKEFDSIEELNQYLALQ